MKYCAKCGKELLDGASVCPDCGFLVQDEYGKDLQQHIVSGVERNDEIKAGERLLKQESSGICTTAGIIAFFAPVAGFVMGIIGLCKYRDENYRNECGWTVGFSVGYVVVKIIIALSMLPKMIS